MASQPKWTPPALPSWFPTAAQEARAVALPVAEVPGRPWSAADDRALRGIAGKHGMVKVLAIALGRSPADLYRRSARLKQLDKRRDG